MGEQPYHSIRKEMQAESVFIPNNLYGVATVVIELVFFFSGVWLLTLSGVWTVGYWVMEIILGISLFRMFVILHECGHKTLFSRRTACTVVGLAMSPFCLVPYVPWRNVHTLHHRWVGVIDKDPTQADLLKLKNASEVQNRLLRLVWKLWIPIPFVKFIFEVFWGYPLKEFRKGNSTLALAGLVSVFVCVAPHAMAAYWVGWESYLAMYGPILYAFYFMIENMNLPQHSGLFPYTSATHPQPIPLSKQDRITRSTHLPPVLSVFLALNFNRHVEHHLFPMVPWYYLPRVTEKLKQAGATLYQDVPFMRFMSDMRAQDPIDIYVNSLPSNSEGV